jgi:hypothetical protein
MRLQLISFASFVLVFTSGCDAGPAPSSSCESDRECQDGDLCNGAERCVGNTCLGGEPSACPAVVPSPCGEVCADDERCEARTCTPVCLVPNWPALQLVPSSARLTVPPGVNLAVVAPGVATAQTLELATISANVLRFSGTGRVHLEATWSEPGDCNPIWTGVLDVVDRLEGSPELAEDAIAADDPRIFAWAEGYRDYEPGTELDPVWTDPNKALGQALGTWDDALSLGNGGRVTMVFAESIADHAGPDLAVFENGFSESFLELAHIEVSSNGVDFVRFPSLSIQITPVEAYGTLDPAELVGLAGRFRAGFGQAFDLATLASTFEVQTGRVDLGAIRFVRVLDVVGDGSVSDAFGNPVYDPTPTFGPAGFDLEAIAALRSR